MIPWRGDGLSSSARKRAEAPAAAAAFFAASRGARIYLTLNTLVKPDELADALFVESCHSRHQPPDAPDRSFLPSRRSRILARQREIRLAANLQHPNILGLYDSGDAGGVVPSSFRVARALLDLSETYTSG